ncbi:MAG: 3-dehydroquinate synthase [Ornithinimicrobium sp.]
MTGPCPTAAPADHPGGSATPAAVLVGSSGTADVYPVHVSAGVIDRLTRWLPPQRRVLVVAQPGRDRVVQEVQERVDAAGATLFTARVPDAEQAKDVTVLSALWQQMGQANFTRDDLVLSVGGGAVSDVAGFAAATWLRGIDVIHLPTSLLGIVDAAVGGKTGINTGEGKNLVGAFYPPAAVLCDPDWLVTMRRGDYVSGLAEVIKCGFIADPAILDLIEADPDAATTPSGPATVDLITRAVRVKADVVSVDLRESSLREILNYGHTLAHAIELVEDYHWRHGDAVAVGMVFAAELGVLAGRTPPELVDRLRRILTSVGLPTAYPAGRWSDLRAAMARDKKSRGSTLRFVVLDEIGSPGRLEGPDEDLLSRAYAALSH